MNCREYSQGDEEGIVSLLVSTFEGWPQFDINYSSLDHWIWKFIDNPYGSIIAVAEESGEIIGCTHTLLKKVKIGKNEYLTGTGVDVAIHELYRGKGIYSKIRQLKDERENSLDLKFRTTVSSNPKLIKRNFREGHYLFPYQILRLTRINNINLHYKKDYKILNKLGYYFLLNINRTRNIFYSYDEYSLDIKIIKEFNDYFNDFWLRVNDYYIIVRDKTYLNWRYCDKRGGDYKIITASIDGLLVGYIVLRINKYNENYPIGYIVDLIVDPKYVSVTYSLLRYAVNYFKDENVNQIRSWNVESSKSKAYNKLDFLSNPDKLYLFISKESVDEKDIKELMKISPERAHFCYGDHDHI